MRAGITLICSWIGLAVIASGLLLAQTNPTVRLLEGSAAGDDSQEDELLAVASSGLGAHRGSSSDLPDPRLTPEPGGRHCRDRAGTEPARVDV